MRRTAVVLTLIAALTVGVSACGSSSKSKSKSTPAASTPATPSTASTSTTAAKPGSLLAQWQSVCSQLHAQAATAKTLPEAGAVLEKLLPKFQAIKPAAAQQADYSQLLSNIQKDVTALKADNKAEAQKLGPANTGLEKKLGLPKCA